MEPKLHPRFHLFNGAPQGHRIFGKCAVSFSKKDGLPSFSELSTVRGRQGTVFINGSQFRSLPEDIRYHTELCDDPLSIASSGN